MKSVLILFLMVVSSTVWSQTTCNKYVDDYIPKDLNDAIHCLDCRWSEENKKSFKEKDEDSAATELHHGTGTALRNGWGLWKGKNKLYRFFKAKGVFHPDDISSIIITSFHRFLNGQPLNLDAQISFYIDYWEKSRKKAAEEDEIQLQLVISEYDSFNINDSVKIHFSVTPRKRHIRLYSIQKYPFSGNEADCFVIGVVKEKIRKYKKHQEYVLKISIEDICGYKKAYYGEDKNGFYVGSEHYFSLEAFKIEKVD